MDMGRFCAGLILWSAVCGCAVGPNYRRPDTSVPVTWSGLKPGATATQPDEPTTQPIRPTTQPAEVATWWKVLNDPTLDGLMDRAMASNLDLRVATARVREARAQRAIVASAFWPQVNVGGSYDYRGASVNAGPKAEGGTSLGKQVRNTAINAVVRSLTSGQTGNTTGGTGGVLGRIANAISQRLQGNGATVPRDQNLFQAGLDASWELDVFGGIRRSVEAADADLAATEESRRGVLVTLLSEVALNYAQLRGSQRRLAIAYDNITSQRDTFELTQERYRVGFISELDVTQAQAQLATTQSQVPLLKSEIRQAIYQLSVLLGRPPGALVEDLEKEAPIPALPPDMPIGLPSDLLRRRPDIRTAERQVAAATARIGEAMADLFPKFSLTGSLGPQVSDISHILDRKSLAWSVGPGVTWPIFEGGAIRANIHVQDARQEQVLATYEIIVLTAFQEVESALVAYMNEKVRHQSLAEAVVANQRSMDLSNELYSRGQILFLNVLESQRALYATQDLLVQSETTAVVNLVALYKALGGGWDVSRD